MGRARPKSKLSAGSPTPKFTIEQLLEKTQEYVDSFQWELAEKFCAKALQMEKDNVGALELMSTVLLETGRTEEALPVLERCVELLPDIGFNKYLTLAQIYDGHEALSYNRRAVSIIEKELSQTQDMEEIEELRYILSTCYCAMAESYLTDLCYDDDAEARCEEFCGLAIRTQPRNPEALQLLSSLRMSQQKPDEAKEAIMQGLSLWYRPREERIIVPADGAKADDDDEWVDEVEDDDDPGLTGELVPSYEVRISTIRLLLELGLHDIALDIAELLLREDDEVVQVWYLCGWASYLKGDREEALHYLTHVGELYNQLGCDDEDLLKHTHELLAELEGAEAAKDDIEMS